MIADINWSDYFYIDDKYILRWKVKTSNRVNVGDEAGNIIKSKGYKRVSLKGRTYKVHRIIWEMHNGPIPEGMYIDHIDHNKINNAIWNLRLVTTKGNSHNLPLYCNNKTGYRGVYIEKGKYRAYIKVDGKSIHLGNFDDIEEAIRCRILNEMKYGFIPLPGYEKYLTNYGGFNEKGDN
ncbi:HNH endonuclease signature motif containing protein [Escherichia coli]|uniref:HNH endonuclease signature motif containing protein n=1 Tax=Escherichia coli TaxID=562 RepID=UPI001915CAB2|nr:HNH endonuclease signature motif containing protein [Escherichia coli]